MRARKTKGSGQRVESAPRFGMWPLEGVAEVEGSESLWRSDRLRG